MKNVEGSLPGGPIIRTSHLKMSLSSTRPAENPAKKIEIDEFSRSKSIKRDDNGEKFHDDFE